MNYYFDTCIWIDYFENRKNLFGKDLGNPVICLIAKIIKNRHKILFSGLVLKELRKQVFDEEINEPFDFLFRVGVLERIEATNENLEEAQALSTSKNLHSQDALHLIIAKSNNAVFVTRDAHFNNFKRFFKIKRPEEL